MNTERIQTELLKPYQNDSSKREQVEEMFDNIADSYDIMNKKMSLGIATQWRNKAISYLKQKSSWPLRILDVATGTGDMALMACAELGPEEVIGIDISEEMMARARGKIEAAGLQDTITIKNEDCEKTSFHSNYFDAVLSAFALRNFQHLELCLKEMCRVLLSLIHI